MSILLNIFIDVDGRRFLLDSNQRIGIIRSYQDSSDLKYICLAFDPFGDNNPVVFSDNWQGITGLTAPVNLEEFKPNSRINVLFGNIYNITNSGFGGRIGPCSTDEVGIANSRTINSPLYTGISQKINDDFCVSNVALTPVNNTSFYKYSTELWIFTATNIVTNMAISSYMLFPEAAASRGTSLTVSKYLSVDLQKDTYIYFDNATNLFKIGKQP